MAKTVNSHSWKFLGATVAAVVFFTAWGASRAGAQVVAPDATEVGPLATTSAEYRFPPSIDPDIIAGRATEIWARLYRPTNLSQGPYPLAVFLHGNHGTCGRGMNPRIDDNCQYTTFGTCPAGYVVAPNHNGYAYVAQRLASWGYLVVSINANRGITCGAGVAGDAGLNLARGRLVLKHLQRLSRWNQGLDPTPPSLGVDLTGQIDFSQTGYMGHSRGGEGMRAAYNLYRDSGSPWPARIPDDVTIKSIFEIGAVDGQTARVLNAAGTVWTQLLPMCDGDVSNLQGVRPFDRMMRIFTESPATEKSTYTVWGANHNFYNTEWQLSDSSGCRGHAPLFPSTIGSPAQRQTGLASIMASVRGNVGGGADPTFNQNFNPQFELPAVVTDVTRVDRGFTDSPHSDVTTPFEDFIRPTGTSTYDIPNDASGITIVHGSVPRHDPVQRGGVISWQSAGPDTYFQTNWAAEGEGQDVSAYQTLDLRLARQNSALNPPDPTNFSIHLAQADGTLSTPVPLNAYTDLRGPVGGPPVQLHTILQTARISLTDFKGADLTQVRGVRLTFDDTATGAIYVANIRLSFLSGFAGASSSPSLDPRNLASTEEPTGRVIHDKGNVVKNLRTVPAAASLENKPGVEIELVAGEQFPVQDELLVLRIGDREFLLSEYSESGDTHSVTFTLTDEEFGGLKSGDEITVQYGRDGTGDRWEFGRLDKSRLDK